MFAVILVLGILIGILLCFWVLVLVRMYGPQIRDALHNPLGTKEAYIAGLSDEESTFRASLPDDKQVEIL